MYILTAAELQCLRRRSIKAYLLPFCTPFLLTALLTIELLMLFLEKLHSNVFGNEAQ